MRKHSITQKTANQDRKPDRKGGPGRGTNTAHGRASGGSLNKPEMVPPTYANNSIVFDASGWEDTLPGRDIITFTIKLRGKAGLYEFLGIIEHDTGCSLLPVRTQAGRYAKKCPITGVTVECEHNFGVYRIYFKPDRYNLGKFQSWIEKFFHGCIEEIKSNVKLYSIELPYDFIIPCCNEYKIYHSLVQRIIYSLWPKNGQNLFTVWIGSPIEEPIFEYKENGTIINGGITCYIQGAKRDKQHLSSESISYNYHASKHTKIYPKGIYSLWRVRVEIELSEGCKDMEGLLDYSNFPSLLDKLSEYPFSRFYEFREADFDSFISHISKIDKAEQIFKNHNWLERIEEARNMPVADQIRIMRALAREIGNKKLRNKILPAYTKIISFTEAINERLPKHCAISRRTKEGERPDKKTKFREPIFMLTKIGQGKILEVKGAAADICPKNSQKLPSEARKSKIGINAWKGQENAGESKFSLVDTEGKTGPPMRRTKFSPMARIEAMKRTKWP